MVFKRLIAVVPVKNRQVTLSYGYKKHNPAGSLQTVLRNLDRWGIDEIVILDITRGLSKPDTFVLDQIRLSAIRTPVAYGGGIRSVMHAVYAISHGCDRVIVESLLWQAPNEIDHIAEAIGQQAVIGAVPLVYKNSKIILSPAIGVQQEKWEDLLMRLEKLSISELIIIDRANEGSYGSNIISDLIRLSEYKHKIIWFGGLNVAQAAKLLARQETVGVGFGNPLLCKELAVNIFREKINNETHQQHLRKIRPHVD